MDDSKVPTNRTKTLELLHCGIAEYSGEKGPGRWRVDECPGRPWVSLSYDVEGSEAERVSKNEDLPWECWGGLDILRRAGVTAYVPFGLSSPDAPVWYSTFVKILPAADA